MKPTVKGSTRSGDLSEDQKMVDKVNQQMTNEEDSLMARVIGLGLIVLGVVFIVLAVVVVVLSRRSARIDEGMTVPEISAEAYTSQDNVFVKGSTDPKAQVMFFVDGDEAAETLEADDEGNFEGFITVPEEEGDYELRASTVVGFPLRKRSNKSERVVVTVDLTPPSADVALDYPDEVKESLFTVKGEIEPFAVIRLEDGEMEYFTIAAEDGSFELEIADLRQKETSYEVTIIDRAGNETVLADRINVTFTTFDLIANGDVNGDGATIGPDLPEASGILGDAFDVIAGNQLMFALGLIALAVLSMNGGYVFFKLGTKRS